MIYTDPTEAAPAFAEALASAERVLIFSHINPDGDAVGSLLGVYHTLRALGKQPLPLASSAIPSYTTSLPGIEAIQVYEPGTPLPEADLIWLVDTASLERIGPIYRDHHEHLAGQPLVIVDHHTTNTGEGKLNLIVPQSASCCNLLLELFTAMGLPITPDGATCLLLGLTTDTQSFQVSSTNPAALRAAANLIEAGANQRLVIEAIYFSLPFSTVRLSALALAGVQQEGGLVWAKVTQAMLKEAGAGDEASDDTVNKMQRIGGLRIGALFKERFDGTVKLSLRSVPGINVAVICQTWGGGGHAQAAGATLPMTMAEAEATVLPILREALAANP
jgi:bifunctional oligoribonuclease and PAP phosphatase NrnA